jgi:hypothetical protein
MFFVCSCCCFGQQGKWTGASYSSSGPSYRGNVALSGLVVLNSEKHNEKHDVELSTTHGVQFNSYFFLGLGYGRLFVEENFVAYADAKINFLSAKNRSTVPFVDVRIGTTKEGLMYGVTGGVTLLSPNKKTGWVFYGGIQVMPYEDYYYSLDSYYPDSWNVGYFKLGVAFEFSLSASGLKR